MFFIGSAGVPLWAEELEEGGVTAKCCSGRPVLYDQLSVNCSAGRNGANILVIVLCDETSECLHS